MARFAAIKSALTSALVAVAVAGVPLAQARGFQDGPAVGGAATVLVTQLPRQGQETYELIRRGGPFPYEKDGAVFGNRERLLPIKTRGYYREYTVKTPGSRDRGARRIVCGGPHQRFCALRRFAMGHESRWRTSSRYKISCGNGRG